MPAATERPLSRVMPCPACGPHEWHLLPCDQVGCGCVDVPIPGTGV
jgi:hypothetical protein